MAALAVKEQTVAMGATAEEEVLMEAQAGQAGTPGRWGAGEGMAEMAAMEFLAEMEEAEG